MSDGHSEDGRHNDEGRLRAAILSGDCVVVVGSGPSTEAGYPDWSQLIETLCGETGVPFELPEGPEKAKAFLTLAARCCSANEARYLDSLASCFGGTPPNVPDTLRYVARLNFKGYVTTAFDPLLRRALEDENKCRTLFKFPDYLPIDFAKVYLWHIHGAIDGTAKVRSADIVLTAGDFERAYCPNGPLSSFLYQLFLFHDCCFVGCGFAEPPFAELLGVCRKIRRELAGGERQNEPREHFALLPQEPPRVDPFERDALENAKVEAERAEGAESERLRALGITIVRYRVDSDGGHIGLRDLLRGCVGPSRIENLKFLPRAQS